MWRRGGLIVSGSPPDEAVRVRALSGDIVLCSWARHLTPTSASLHPGAQMGIGQLNAGRSHLAME